MEKMQHKIATVKKLMGIAKKMEMDDAQEFKKKRKGGAPESQKGPAEGCE